MTIAIPLSKNDIRLLGHGYIWIETQELFKTQKPDFSQPEITSLDSFLAMSGKVEQPTFDLKKFEMTTSALSINSEVVLEGTQNIARLIQCAQLFLEELKENPKEIEAVSSVPFSNLPDLALRLKALQTPEGES